MIRHLRLIDDKDELCEKCNGSGVIIGEFEGIKHRVMCYGVGACWGSGIKDKPFDDLYEMHKAIQTMKFGAEKMKEQFEIFAFAWNDIKEIRKRLDELEMLESAKTIIKLKKEDE